MSIILFIIILAVLVFVHELGHFLFGKKVGETIYSINAIPFGGFVKIFGEDPNDESINGQDRDRSFVHKKRPVQAAVLVAGVLFNFLFAFVLNTVGFASGFPVAVEGWSGQGQLQNIQLLITDIVPESPASFAGLKSGDALQSLKSDKDKIEGDLEAEEVRQFIRDHASVPIAVSVSRKAELFEFSVETKIMQGEPNPIIGISMEKVASLRLPIHLAVLEGFKMTYFSAKSVLFGFGELLKQAFHGGVSISQLTGPVGIAGMVGSARDLGISYLLSFTAFLSINLAVLNLLPFPALDGGLILFVTYQDIAKLF